MARRQASGTPAIDALVRAGVRYTLHDYEHDPAQRAFGDETVAALGVAPERVFKTLVAEVSGSAGTRLVVGLVPVSGQLNLKALAAAVGAKRAVMAEPAKAERSSGFVVGGISPLGQKTGLPTVADESVTGFDTVFVSAGRRGQQIELSPHDLLRLTGASLAPIGR